MLARPDVAVLSNYTSKVDAAVPAVYGRPPSDEEFVDDPAVPWEPATDQRRWQSLAQAILMANEFVFVD